ncbi:MAG: hypothetical protein AAF518_24160, partial [Spirochaetota bacterium]
EKGHYFWEILSISLVPIGTWSCIGSFFWKSNSQWKRFLGQLGSTFLVVSYLLLVIAVTIEEGKQL